MIAPWPRREPKRRWAVQASLLCILPSLQLVSSIPFFLAWATISLAGVLLRRTSAKAARLPFIPFCLILYALQFLSFCALSDLAHIRTQSVAAVSAQHADQLLTRLTRVLGRDRVQKISSYFDRRRAPSSSKVEILAGLPELMNISWNEQLASADDQPALELWKDAGLEAKGTSIVIAAYQEHKYIQRTIDSVLKESPLLGLAELIIVDDNNEPPLRTAISEATLAHPLVKIIRNEEYMGLIRSKQIGGDAAKGDYIVFLDGHVKPYARWLVHMRREGLTNWKRIAVPAIPILDGETWEQEGEAVGYKMMFGWDLTFNWFEDDNDEVPCMSGGLLGLTKEWWNYTQGLDSGMEVWGGENVEQSIRTWLSGGEIVVARDARIPHVFRSSFPYPVNGQKVALNKVRTVEVWFDEWKEEVWKKAHFGTYRERLASGALDKRKELRQRIAIHDFNWYVKRFRSAFVSKKMIKTLHFRITTPSGLCLAPAAGDDRILSRVCEDDETDEWHIWGQEMLPIYPSEVGKVGDGEAVSFNPYFVPMSAVGHSRHHLVLRHAASGKCLLPPTHPRGLMHSNFVDKRVVVGDCVRQNSRVTKRDWSILHSYRLESGDFESILAREAGGNVEGSMSGPLRWGSLCLREESENATDIFAVLCKAEERENSMFRFEKFTKHV